MADGHSTLDGGEPIVDLVDRELEVEFRQAESLTYDEMGYRPVSGRRLVPSLISDVRDG
jgi:hypothetical protein